MKAHDLSPVQKFMFEAMDGRLTRRQVLQRAAVFGLSAPAISALLAACGGDDDDDEATNTATESSSSGDSTESSTEESSTEASDEESSEETEEATSDDESTSEATEESTESSSGDSGDAQTGGSLRVVFAEEPKNVHPQIDSGTEGWYVVKQIFESLLNVDSEGEIVPGLAAELPETPDDVTYIFKLREGATFHNGKPFTADDVLWSIDRLHGKIEGQASTQAERFQGIIASVEKIDDFQVQFNLNQPSPDLPYMMAAGKYLSIMEEESVLEAGENYGLTAAVGTGPFKFKEWIQGDRLTIERFEDYWDGPSYLDEVVYQGIPEESTRMASLKAGDIDVLLDPSLKDVSGFQEDDKFQVQTHSSGNMKYVGFNTSREPFTDIKVRQAMAYAIDRQEIVDAIYYGFAAVGQDILPPWNEAHNPDLTFYPYDPDKATELLAEAGYDSGNQLEFELVCSNATEYVDLATLIQAQLQRIDVKVNVLPLDKSAFAAKTFPPEVGTPNPDYQAHVYRLIFGFETSDYTWRTFHPDSALDLWGYNQPGGAQNPEVVELLDEAAQTIDVAKQKELYTEISKLINEDMPMLHLAFQDNVNISRAEVKDLGIIVLDVMPLNKVWLDE